MGFFPIKTLSHLIFTGVVVGYYNDKNTLCVDSYRVFFCRMIVYLR